MRDLSTKKGTIAYILNAHKDELFELISNNNIKGARNKAVELLNSSEISDKSAVITAKEIFTKSKDNLFLSSLMSYMTGMKDS